MSQSLTEQLSILVKEHPEVTKPSGSTSRIVECSKMLLVERDETGITVQAVDQDAVREAFLSTEFLFLCIRSHLKALNPKSAWTIRYGSEIRTQDLPFLLDHVGLIAAIDPLAPYRSAIKALSSGESVYMILIKPRPFFAKKRDNVEKLNSKAKNGNDNFSGKKGSSPAKPKGKHGGHNPKSSGTLQSYRPPEVYSDEDPSAGGASTGVQPENH